MLYSVQRRFGGAEQAAKQAITKGYAGEVYHARAAWMRTRGIPIGTGWFIERSKAGGGALIDIGVHMLDLAWYLLGQPKPVSAYGVVYQKFKALVPKERTFDVDDSAFALIRFADGKSLELGAELGDQSAAATAGGCRAAVFGDEGSVDVYTADGSTIYRHFTEKGESRSTVLKPPRVVSHAAMMRHFRECILGRATPIIGAHEGVMLMQMLDAIYKSSASGKSVEIK